MIKYGQDSIDRHYGILKIKKQIPDLGSGEIVLTILDMIDITSNVDSWCRESQIISNLN